MGGETFNDATTSMPASTSASVSSRETADAVPPACLVPSKAPETGTENGDPRPPTAEPAGPRGTCPAGCLRAQGRPKAQTDTPARAQMTHGFKNTNFCTKEAAVFTEN